MSIVIGFVQDFCGSWSWTERIALILLVMAITEAFAMGRTHGVI